MKLNKDQAKAKAIDTIENKVRHPDYLRTIEIADLNSNVMTGDVDSMLLQFKPRESTAAWLQRKRLTKVITPALTNSVKEVFEKVPRTDRVVKKILTKDKKSKSKIIDTIQKKMNVFYGSDNEEGGLDFWLKNRFPELSFLDPNTFIVIEFDEYDAKEQTPNAYPFEVRSDMAVNFEIENNNVDWLISREPISFIKSVQKSLGRKAKSKYEMMPGYKYTIYCGEFSMVFRQVNNDASVRKFENIADNEMVMKIGEDTFAVSEYDTFLPDWQMFRIGYVRDLKTDGRTFVSPLQPAMNYLEDSIKDISEFQLTKTTHVFPQKFSYVSPCNGGWDETKKKSLGCDRGRTTAGTKCEVCNGTGANVHTSAQDVVTFPLPNLEDGGEMMDLTKMVAYFAPPIELLKFQDEQVDKYEQKIHMALFGTTSMIRTTFTATEKEQDMDSVYDRLRKFAEKSASCYLNIANAIAYLLGYENGEVSFVFRYPSDFKMKSKLVLYNEMKTVKEANVPSFVVESIEDDLANSVYVDDVDGMLRYNVEKAFKPFRGLNDEQLAFALGSSMTLAEDKILFLSFSSIISEAIRDNTNFVIKEYKEQKPIIDGIVARYKTALTPEAPKLPVIVEPA